MKRIKIFTIIAIVLIAGCFFSSCARFEVVSGPNKENIALDADDIVMMMHRAGFTKQEIFELGPDLRNTMATTGAARAVIGKKVEAIFTATDHYVYVNSRKRGSFIYDTSEKTIR